MRTDTLHIRVILRFIPTKTVPAPAQLVLAFPPINDDDREMDPCFHSPHNVLEAMEMSDEECPEHIEARRKRVRAAADGLGDRPTCFVDPPRSRQGAVY